MPIQVERLPNEPIVLVTMEEPLDFRNEVLDMLKRIVAGRDSIAEPVPCYYVVFDFTRYTLQFTDIVYALGELRGIRDLRRADRPARMMVVGVGGVIELGVKALTQRQYGSYQSRLFDTVEQALAAARQGDAGAKTPST